MYCLGATYFRVQTTLETALQNSGQNGPVLQITSANRICLKIHCLSIFAELKTFAKPGLCFDPPDGSGSLVYVLGPMIVEAHHNV